MSASPPAAPPIVNALTIDVEDRFRPNAMDAAVSRAGERR